MRQLYRLNQLVGFKLEARDGEIGKITEVYFDDAHWTVRYFVVDTGHWLARREVLVSPGSVTGVDNEGEHLAVDLTREKVENSPEVDDERPVSRHYEQEFVRYYGWERYWVDDALVGHPESAEPPPSTSERFIRRPDHSHLHSSDEVIGYHIQAADGEIGHIVDFVLDDQDWKIRYLEIDTRNWLHGKWVLIAPAWVRKVSWPHRRLHLDLKRSVIASAPEYNPERLITPEYEVLLHAHFGKAL